MLPCAPAAMILAHLSGADQYISEMGFLFQLVGNNTFSWVTRFCNKAASIFHWSHSWRPLNVTSRNTTEMIISLYALKNGMIRIVQQSLLGFILSNMLLVLGCAFLMGGVIHHRKEQVFNKAAAVVNSGLLLMAVMGLLFPDVLHFTHTQLHKGKSELSLSRFSSCVMLVAYKTIVTLNKFSYQYQQIW